jgi:hypothetical protein
MKAARIVDGIVVEIMVPAEGFSLAQCYHPAIIADCVFVDDSVQVGDAYPAPVVEEPAE